MRSIVFVLILSFSQMAISCSPAEKVADNKQQENYSTKADTSEWSPAESPLMTRWAKDVSPDNVLPKYPRPQMERDEWKNLNGLWQYAKGEELDDAPFGQNLAGEILVPFAIESALSGVKERTDTLWYRHTFEIPSDWDNENILLHFGAVDWKATVYVNGQEVGVHKGGFDKFSFDITDHLIEGKSNELVVKVFDPSDDGDQPRGKQVKEPQGIWYTPVTGIWQTVWLEPVSQNHISDLKLTPDIDNEQLKIVANTEGANQGNIKVTAYKDGKQISSATAKANEEFTLPISNPELWSPDNPFLYDLKVELVTNGKEVDKVDSYFGMRKIEIKKNAEGKAKIFLNNEESYQLGPLDQGYWPDGLYTAPTDEALRYDLEMTKRMGFNMNRKHVKIEPDRWYYWADKLGVLVWQDMVTGSNTTDESRKQYEHELKQMVDQFYNHPSIVNWIIFNEGWGQFDTKRITKEIEEMDESRLITDASGWQHHGEGDLVDVHRYPGPTALKPTSDRAAVGGEFGGVGYVINGHTWGGDGWGYQDIIRKPEAFIDRYEELIHKLRWLSDEHGMSGGVYTQITDLETELNGLLTYDREIAKAAPQQLAAVNEGITPYIHPFKGTFMHEVKVELRNWVQNTEIRYTLDGSDPDTSSKLYNEPFVVNENTTVRARTFENGVPIGYANSNIFTKVEGKQPMLDSTENLTQGLMYEYYESAPENEPTYRKHWGLRRLLAGNNPNLNPENEGETANFTLEPSQRDKLFAVEYTGYINIPEDGDYTFYIEADDDAKLYLNGKQIFDRLGQSPRTAYDSERVSLKSGLHEIELRYFQAYGPSQLNVLIEGPGLEKQPIPDEYLYYSE